MKSSRILIAAAVALVAVTSLSACSVPQVFGTPVKSEIYATHSDMTASSTAPFGSPKWVPDDATTIRVDYKNSKTAIISYTSKTHFVAGQCATPVGIPKPSLQDSWWPTTGFPAQGAQCADGWKAFAIGDQIYATIG